MVVSPQAGAIILCYRVSIQQEDATCNRVIQYNLLFLSFVLGLQERKETIRGVYSVIDQLSRTHLNTLERLIFHLVR